MCAAFYDALRSMDEWCAGDGQTPLKFNVLITLWETTEIPVQMRFISCALGNLKWFTTREEKSSRSKRTQNHRLKVPTHFVRSIMNIMQLAVVMVFFILQSRKRILGRRARNKHLNERKSIR